jgi:retrograde regulation protein 2
MYIHNPMNKDMQAASALRSTTTGVLANVHGANHEERAMLAIMLCERWGGIGTLSPGDEAFYRRLMELIGPETGWWCMFGGRLGTLLGEVYPAGVVRGKDKVALNMGWKTADKGTGKKALEKATKNKQKQAGPDNSSPGSIQVDVNFGRDEEGIIKSMGVRKAVKQLQKLGKKKNWPEHGKSGHEIALTVRSAAAGGEVNLSDEA